MSQVPSTHTRTELEPVGRIEIFLRLRIAVLLEAGMMHAEVPPPAARAAAKRDLRRRLSQPVVVGVLFRSPSPNGFSLVDAWFKSNFPPPAEFRGTARRCRTYARRR